MPAANQPTAAPRLPTPVTEVSLEWADQFIRALTIELGKIVQPIGTRYLVAGFATNRTLTGPATRNAVCRVGTVTVKTNTPGSTIVAPRGLGGDTEPLAVSPVDVANTLATLISDLQIRGWLA
jgi:hypothetical protein